MILSHMFHNINILTLNIGISKTDLAMFYLAWSFHWFDVLLFSFYRSMNFNCTVCQFQYKLWPNWTLLRSYFCLALSLDLLCNDWMIKCFKIFCNFWLYPLFNINKVKWFSLLRKFIPTFFFFFRKIIFLI